ncbi:hypothetical protein GGG16DRAFT_103001 [Schizophyllum commune]
MDAAGLRWYYALARCLRCAPLTMLPVFPGRQVSGMVHVLWRRQSVARSLLVHPSSWVPSGAQQTGTHLRSDVLSMPPSVAASASGDWQGEALYKADAFCGWIATAVSAYAAGSTAEPVAARSAIVGLVAEIGELMSLMQRHHQCSTVDATVIFPVFAGRRGRWCMFWGAGRVWHARCRCVLVDVCFRALVERARIWADVLLSVGNFWDLTVFYEDSRISQAMGNDGMRGFVSELIGLAVGLSKGF